MQDFCRRTSMPLASSIALQQSQTSIWEKGKARGMKFTMVFTDYLMKILKSGISTTPIFPQVNLSTLLSMNTILVGKKSALKFECYLMKNGTTEKCMQDKKLFTS